MKFHPKKTGGNPQKIGSPHVFVAGEGQEVDGGQVSGDGDQIKAQEDAQHFQDQPGQGRARHQTEAVRRKSGNFAPKIRDGKRIWDRGDGGKKKEEDKEKIWGEKKL